MKRKHLYILTLLPFVLFACLGNEGRVGEIKDHEEERVAELDQEDFQLAEFAPTDTVPWENVEGGVWVIFNKPVIPLGKLGKPAKTSKVMQITPSIEGIYRWYGSRLLSFEPETRLEPAVEYNVSIDPKLVSLEGERLSGMNRFSFKTEALKLLYMEPSGSDVPPEECRALTLTFNYPVELKTIEGYIKVEAKGREYPFGIGRPESASGIMEGSMRAVVLKLTQELPWDTEISVRLLEGAKPGPKNYGIPEEQLKSFHTLKPFGFERAVVYDWLATVEAALIFNHPVLEKDMLSQIQVELEGYEPAKNVELYGNALYLKNLPVEFESSFSVNIGAGLSDIYNQRFGHDETLEMEVGPAGSYVSFRAWGDKILEAQFPPIVAVEFQNIEKGAYTAGRLSHPFQEIPESPFTPYDKESIPRNTRIFRMIDFSPFLNEEGKGSAYAKWNFMVPSWWSDKPVPQNGELRLQVTDLGFSSVVAHNKVLILASSLSTGKPLANAQAILKGKRGEWKQAVTDENGLASFIIYPGELNRFFHGSERTLEVELELDKDRLIFRPYEAPSYNWNFYGPFNAEKSKPLTYLCSDRGIYRPGEELSFFGIDLNLKLGKFKANQGAFTVELKKDWYGDNVLASVSGRLSPSGRFWGGFKLTEDLEPDQYFLVYKREDEKYERQITVRVAFFRRVNFSVELSMPETEKFMGDRLEARFAGKYLAGGNVIQGNWNYWWARKEIEYSPPDDYYRSFHFGTRPDDYYEDLSAEEGSLSGDGSVVAVEELGDGKAGRVYRYEVTATVEDIDRQVISKHASIPVFTSELLIGGKSVASPGEESPLYFVKEQEPFFLKACAVRPGGTPYAPVSLEGKLIREKWKLVRERGIGGVIDTQWKREEVVESSFTLEMKKERSGRILAAQELKTENIGSYLIELRAKDFKGREALTRFSFYSTGSGTVLWRRYNEKEIDIVLDKKRYIPGEKATLLIKSPLNRGRYLLTLEREGIIEERILDFEGSTRTVEIEIKEEYIPVVYVTLSSWSGRETPPPRTPDLPDLGKPKGYFGLKVIHVETDQRRIALDIHTSKKSFKPGSEAEVTIKATWKGAPLEGTEIAFIAADRGVLDLIDYHIPDPLAFFYSRYNFPHRVAHYDTRELLIDPVTWKVRDMPGGDKEGEELGEIELRVRKDFRATAVFEPSLITGKDGTVDFRFKLPDQLTRYRATAVAIKSGLFGLVEDEILVQNPMNVRTAMPRRLRIGDQAEAGVVITNLDGEQRRVTVKIESDLLDIKDKREKKVLIKAGDSKEVAFRFTAPRQGTASITFTIDGEILKEKLIHELEVEQSFVSEVFTIIGQTTDTVSEGFAIPDSFAGTPDEGLILSLDSTLASSLTGAIRFLDIYPYDCLEQRTSKLFAYILYDWLIKEIEGGKDSKKVIEQELSAFTRYKSSDGGFSFWEDPGYRVSNYYVSLRTAHLIFLALKKGYAIAEETDTESLLEYLKGKYQDQNLYLKSYALYILSLFGADVLAEGMSLLKEGDRLGLLGYGFLGLTFDALGERNEAERILKRINNYLRVGTRSVTLIEPADSWSYIGGQVQAKALLLILYRRMSPESQIGQALANDLLDSNRNGYWLNTSNTGWVLQAFAEYLENGKEREADFTAYVTLGNSLLASASFKGLSLKPYNQRIEAGELLKIAKKDEWLPLTISRKGSGTLYYTATLKYALDPTRVEARDEGIGLFTEILDLSGREVGNRLKLGEVYRMKIVLYSSRDRDYLALRIPIPSGAEVIDGSLATSRIVREEEIEYDCRPIKRIYDNEVRFFYNYFYKGKKELSFLFRTTTPGSFPTPPAVAEMMYEGEVFGRTGGQNYRIAP